MMLLNRMSIRPGILWVTLNLALIIQCLQRNNIYFFQFHIPREMSSLTLGATLTPS
jgi:hypothetical protein